MDDDWVDRPPSLFDWLRRLMRSMCADTHTDWRDEATREARYEAGRWKRLFAAAVDKLGGHFCPGDDDFGTDVEEHEGGHYYTRKNIPATDAPVVTGKDLGQSFRDERAALDRIDGNEPIGVKNDITSHDEPIPDNFPMSH